MSLEKPCEGTSPRKERRKKRKRKRNLTRKSKYATYGSRRPVFVGASRLIFGLNILALVKGVVGHGIKSILVSSVASLSARDSKNTKHRSYRHILSERGGGEGGCIHVMHGRSRMTIDSGIPAVPGRSMSGFHRPGGHCLHQTRSTVRCWARVV